MTPILYEKDEIDFTSQGLGSLVEIYDADVAEQRNGLLQLTASYPVTGVRYDDISVGRIILAKPNQRDEPHAFRITSTDLDIMGHNVMIEADSITYDLNHNIVKHVSVNGQSGQAMMTALQMAVVNPSIFTFYSDITHMSSTSLDYVNPMEAVMGVKGSFLQIWGGELKRENRRVAMFNRRGRDNVATFRLGKNISGLKYKVDISSLVTRILPIKSVQENDTTTYLEGTPVSSQYINSYEQIYTIKVDFTDDTIKTVDDLNKASANWFVDSANTARDKPSVTIDIDVLSLQDSADYQDKFKDLESVALTDTVTVYVPEYGINVTAIVNELHFDPIQERVTKLTVGTAKQSFADSSRTQLSDLQDKIISVQNQADATAVSANGKSTNYYGSVEPSHPQGGDTWFWVDGDKSGIKVFVDGDWVEPVDSDTQEKIEAAVDDALTQANAYSDQLVADNVAQVNTVLDDVQAKQADLTAQQAELDTKAKGYADKALADAKADTLATATQTAKDASDALAKAKTDLTTSLNKEVTDRANAVTALDTKAKGYADTAKADAISAGATADGVINKKIDDTASSITSTISQNKADADGKITTAQSTATQALNGLATKVSQTVYDAKTGQLQTDLNTTTTTANQAKTDIVAIKSDNTKQDARMTTIESDANGTKTTVSNLQTDLGKANGSITTLQQRADGFDATVTKVNNMAIGGRNWLLDSKTPKSATGNNGTNQIVIGYGLASGMNSGKMVSDWGAGTYITLSFDWTVTGTVTSGTFIPQFYPQPYSPLGPKITVSSTNTSGHYTGVKVVGADWAGTSAPTIDFRLDGFQGVFTVSNIKLEQGNMPTAWTPAPEDVDGATAKAQLTADQATTSLNTYKSDADGRISKAQADIIVNANAITQKVSQSDYNAKTDDLTTKVNTAQSTADSATSSISAYKTSNDARVASAESKITANATAITQKVSQTDYNTKTGQIDGQISTINQTAGKISQSVADVNGRIDNISVGGTNLLLGSQDFTGTGTERWVISGTIVANAYQGLSAVQSAGAWSGPKYQESNLVARWGALDTTNTFTLSEWVRNTSTTQVDIKFYGDNVQGSGKTVATLPANSDWVRVSAQFKFLVATPSSGARIRFEPITGVTGGYVQHAGMKLESGTLASSYSPAPEDTDNKISTVSQTVDSISSIVSDPTTGLTKRVQTAEGTLSQVTGADIPALQKATYWQAPNGYDLNTYLTQGSTFFRDTTARTNSPTTSTKWMYLVVERTPNGDRVTQTAWYDTQTDAKITYRRQYAGTWGSWYANDNDSVTTISQTNGAIQQEITNRQTGDTNTLTSAKNFTTSSISNSESGMRSLVTQTSDAILGKVGAVNLFPNSEFEKDYGYRSKNGNTVLSLGSKHDVDGKINGVVWVSSTASGWQGYWASNIEVQGGQRYSVSTLVHYTNGGITDGKAQLDVYFIDKDGVRIADNYGDTGVVANTLQVSSPYWVKLYREGMTAPANAVNLQVSLLVNDKGIGQTAAFTQPMVTATEKLQPYTPNNDITTQLTLLKDNWSIGIADNTGAIASGIAADSNAMNIVSPKVIISSPQTQITGTAWIKTAMIGNGQIGTAQIGDASIDTAKIASLDVAKLTGNVSSFIQSNWNGVFASTMIDNTGMSINGGNTTTKFDTTGAHYSNSSGINATYSFGKWSDSNSNTTSATGLYIGATGSSNAFINILSTNGAAALVLAGTAMDFGSNLNVLQGALNAYVNVNIRERLMFKANRYVGGQPSYIEVDEINRTFNFFTGGGSGTNKDYFYFNQNVISAGTFSSTSVLSKKNVKSVYDEDALGEIAKTQLVNFEYKNRIGQNHVSPIIDDVNSEKEYYIPKTILGQDNEYVDLYSMISMTWKAIQQLNEKIGEK